MKAATLTIPFKIDISDDVEIPVYGAEEVLIRVMATGICGSDMHAYRGLHPFRKPPVVLGHEVAGEVVATGQNVRGICVGDHVVIEPQQGCGECGLCNAGQYHLCAAKRVPGIHGWLGSFAEFFVAPASCVYRVTTHMKWEMAALTEPLAVGFHAAGRSMAISGERVAVLGAGTIGLCCIMALCSHNVESIVATDISRTKLGLAESFGAKGVLAGSETSRDVRSALGGPADVVIVCTEYPGLLEDVIAISGPRTRTVFLSLFEKSAPFNPTPLVIGEHQWIGSVTYTKRDFESALKLLVSETHPFQQLISKCMPLSEANAAFELLNTSDESLVKIVLTP